MKKYNEGQYIIAKAIICSSLPFSASMRLYAFRIIAEYEEFWTN